ncbi:hypothetical protein HY498_01870 [Candidatus Woesearchaeota archaeon]|nr:hypothetical protein [Candidatus Woesearchaeota archaeon]
MAKGMIITLGIVLLAGILIVGISLISKNLISHDKTITILAENELILGMDTSLEKSISKMFKEKSNINITKISDSLEISETIPYTSTMLSEITKLNEILNSKNVYWVKTNTTTFEKPIIKFEDNSLYIHETNGNSLKLNTINNLDIEIKLSGEITGCNLNTEPGSFRLKLYAYADNGTCSFEENIDNQGNNEIDIITENSITNVLIKESRFYIGNSTLSYRLKINNTALFLIDAYEINLNGKLKSGAVRLN